MLVAYLRSMNKIYIPGVIVVEGKEDVSYLSSFVDSQFFTTNGYDISKAKLEFLKRVSEVNRIIVLTDNDEAGKKISEVIKKEICAVIDIKTDKITRKNYKKSGVAETPKEEVLGVLSPYSSNKEKHDKLVDYQLNKIISLSSDSEMIKSKIVNDYRLIDGNTKYLSQQLQMLKIEPKEIIEKYGN